MSGQSGHRRGFVMALVLAVMSIAAGTVAALTYFSAGYYRAHQADRFRLVTQAVSHSATAYVRAHAGQWATQPPVESIMLDVAELLPTGAAGSVEVAFPASGPGTCRITIRVERGRFAFEDQIDWELPAPPASTSAPSGPTSSP